MPILTEGSRTADFLLSEERNYRSRDEVTVTVPANTTLDAGTVLGKITASGKFVRHNAGAANGSETEAGILFEPLVNTTGSAVDDRVTIISRDAVVSGWELTYEDGADNAQTDASNAALVSLGIVVRY